MSTEVEDGDRDPTHHDEVKRLSRDLANAAKTLSDDEARFLVDSYYAMQDNRKRSDQQMAALEKAGEPSQVLAWFGAQQSTLENQIKRALNKYVEAKPIGAWLMGLTGIGPVISAGLLAHIDIEKAPTVGHIWRFAGLDPTCEWKAGEKRPWNGALKTLCWKIGESFVKFCNHPDCYYGKIYKQRKEFETANNAAGKYKAQAAAMLQRKKFRKDTTAKKSYEAGVLPDAHIHARAKRYATKLFLAHFHQKWYELHFGKPAPVPYPIAHLGHVHMIPPP